MKKKLLLLSFLSLAFVILQSSINGVSTAQLLDRTNSPLTAGNCSACHSGGSFESNMTIELIDKNDKIVTNYIPGENYTIRYSINATGATKYGIQSTVLGTETNNAGVLTAKSANSKVTDLNKRTYLDHKTASNDNIFEATWKAPDTDIGIVKIYSSGLAANGNSATTGDKPINIDPLSIAPSTQSIFNPELSLKVYPNPTINSLTIESAETPQSIEIYDITGQLQLSNNNSKVIITNTLESGIYIIKVNIGNQVFNQKVLKN
jgi:hypothetical protein